MNNGNSLDILIAQWSRAGAGFNAEPAGVPIDLERLLLETARHAPASARLFPMAATWLHQYGELIARHRLKRLIHDELEADAQSALGLLLEIAHQGTHPLRFETITKQLPAAGTPGPLFEAERRTAALRERAWKRASDLARRWGLWTEPIAFKPDALRSPRWIFEKNPGFVQRADFRGDLRASILASLTFDADAGESELALARAAGGSRAQVRQALDNLELTNRARRMRAGRRCVIRLQPEPAAAA
jgi:hypothetical protein